MDTLADGRDRVQMKLFSVERPGGFGRDFRIRSTRDGPPHERHPLWFSAVEFFGVLRVRNSKPENPKPKARNKPKPEARNKPKIDARNARKSETRSAQPET